MALKIVYEWVVETLDENAEIVNCSYFDERDLEIALHFRSVIKEPTDFGLCRRIIDGIKGDVERVYSYRQNNGRLRNKFDNGRPIPVRFLKRQLG